MNELEVTRCATCGHIAWPARLLCPECGSPGADAVPAGPGEVRERTETRTPGGEPVTLVTVELDAGPWVVARCGGEAAPGDSVRLRVASDGAIETEGT
jgi:uncharacterized protein